MGALLIRLLKCFGCAVSGFLLLLVAYLIVNMTTNMTISITPEFYRTLLPFYLIIGTGIAAVISTMTRHFTVISPIVIAAFIHFTAPSIT